VEAADHPLSIVVIHQFARIQAPGLGIATAYRCIKRLCEDGSVRPIMLPDGQQRYAPRHRSWSYLMLCTTCGRLIVGPAVAPGRPRLPNGSACLWKTTLAEGTCCDCAHGLASAASSR
jgi:Fe2+ or Zn2+ uptake regulation protein